LEVFAHERVFQPKYACSTAPPGWLAVWNHAKSASPRILRGEGHASHFHFISAGCRFGTSTVARAQQTKDCKACREYQQACVKNHTRDACNNEYNICMKYCGKK
jgi:hypothetical protein